MVECCVVSLLVVSNDQSAFFGLSHPIFMEAERAGRAKELRSGRAIGSALHSITRESFGPPDYCGTWDNGKRLSVGRDTNLNHDSLSGSFLLGLCVLNYTDPCGKMQLSYKTLRAINTGSVTPPSLQFGSGASITYVVYSLEGEGVLEIETEFVIPPSLRFGSSAAVTLS